VANGILFSPIDFRLSQEKKTLATQQEVRSKLDFETRLLFHQYTSGFLLTLHCQNKKKCAKKREREKKAGTTVVHFNAPKVLVRARFWA
jgi:hypothetical protein